MERRRPRVRRIDGHAWLLTAPSSPVRIARLGSGGLGPTVLYDPEDARQRARAFERSLNQFVARRHISWLLRELRVNVVLDVGANVGQYADKLRRRGYNGRIVSFEPVAELSAALRQRASTDNRWQVHGYALGDEETEAEINVVPGTMSSLLDASRFGKDWSEKLRQSRTETIRVRRLEDVLDEVTAGVRNPRVYLKMDTQGFDLQTFRGAGERVSELLGLQSEVSCVPIYEGMPRMVEQLAEYERAGFELTGMFPVSRDKPTMRVIEFDAIMIGPRALEERAAGQSQGR
jgi:FkbM family methyltransferase